MPNTEYILVMFLLLLHIGKNYSEYYFQSALDEATEPWGVKVERVEVKDVRVPEQLQRAMAAEAEAAREARAKVIAAEGEHKASRALKHAAEVIIEKPAALQVEYLCGNKFTKHPFHANLSRRRGEKGPINSFWSGIS